MKIQRINVTTGVGDLKFTMSEQDIIQLLGKPTTIDTDTLNKCLVYYYDDLNLAVVFVEIDGQMIIDSFEMENVCYQLWDKPIVKQNFNAIIDLFKQNNISDFEQHKNEYGSYIMYKNLFIEFDKENDIATDFSLSNPTL